MNNYQIVWRSVMRGGLVGALISSGLVFSITGLVVVIVIVLTVSNGQSPNVFAIIALMSGFFGFIIGVVPATVLGALTGLVVGITLIGSKMGNAAVHGLKAAIAASLILILITVVIIFITSSFDLMGVISIWYLVAPFYLGASFWMGRRVHCDLLQTPA